MTEVTCSLLGWDSTATSIPGSVGELNANCSAKIMDTDGKTEVPRGERGEIWVQGPKFVSLDYRLYFRPLICHISEQFPSIFPPVYIRYFRLYAPSIFTLPLIVGGITRN
jgi:hypothetical protein